MRFSTSITFLFGEIPFSERFAAARKAGFSGVEIQIMEGEPEDAAKAAREADIEVALLNVDMGDLLGGGPGLSGVPGREPEFVEAARAGLAAAETMGCRRLHLGPSRIPASETREACLASFLANVDLILPEAEEKGIQLLIEPMNTADMPDALFAAFEDVAAMIRRTFKSGVGLQYDVYHAARNGLDPVSAFKDFQDVITHIQFSDVPGRGAPGSGEVDFDGFFAAVRAAGYNGWLGAEYFSSEPAVQTFGWLKKYG